MMSAIELIVMFVCLVQLTLSRPTQQNSTTIVHAGADSPVTLNNVVYCNNQASKTAEWEDIVDKTRRKMKPCARTMYAFSEDPDSEDYIRVKTPIPQMDHVTVCASFFSGATGMFRGTLLSYATNTNVNSLIIFGDVNKDGANVINIFINAKGKSFGVQLPKNEMVHICVIFNVLEAHVDLYLNGEYIDSEKFESEREIFGDGFMLIGQEQDALLDQFDPQQAFRGRLANFFLWDRMLSKEEVQVIGRKRCGCIGDYIISLDPEFVQLYGKVRPMHLTSCPNTDSKITLIQAN